ncbi:hemerythrin domain-containing protein [Frankia sp. AgPm24]|uniref:Hemerythrin domain-containing protein n=1 Tax=Frankia umida TaxID=573489 RepID=A0ABT0JSD7_9ACTN|nr:MULTISPECIES: hemerythrin domain-containing protein [Frankia]MCK9874270.1 hemerythrin domain-containing protein [Frankia umida]MCK9921061.1 hemerythrin domain-containing protein [Frankia sp. AgPm24]
MSDYCWCLATPAIDDLIREHDELVELSALARAAYRCGDIEALVESCTAITSVLGPHTEVEERGLFPPMAVEFPEKIAILCGEHRRIEAVLAGATDGTAGTDPAWPARVIETLTLLRRHIVKEQEGLFPAALSVLSSDDWELLAGIRDRCGMLTS